MAGQSTARHVRQEGGDDKSRAYKETKEGKARQIKLGTYRARRNTESKREQGRDRLVRQV